MLLGNSSEAILLRAHVLLVSPYIYLGGMKLSCTLRLLFFSALWVAFSLAIDVRVWFGVAGITRLRSCVSSEASCAKEDEQDMLSCWLYTSMFSLRFSGPLMRRDLERHVHAHRFIHRMHLEIGEKWQERPSLLLT